jgi:diguanylate cyclase (GGDEF)-like protein
MDSPSQGGDQMSGGHGWRAAKDRWSVARPAAWSLWRAPRPLVVYVLAVDVAAVAVVASTVAVAPIAGPDLLRFGLLALGSAVHLEVIRGAERPREPRAESRVFADLGSVWTLAGLLVLPPPLVAALIALTHLHRWLRLGQRVSVHRWVWSACGVVLACAAGGVVLAVAAPHGYPGPLHGPAGFAAAVAATATRWLVGRALSGLESTLLRPGAGRDGGRPGGRAFGAGPHNLVECAAMALGVLAAALMDDPAYLAVFAAMVAVLHRGLTAPQHQSPAQRDPVTGAHNAGFWHELAGRTLERAAAQRAGAGLLLVHLDQFAAINRRHGPAACDRALRCVAAAVRAAVRRGDLVGRLPGGDLAVVLPGAAEPDLAALAERIRRSVRALSVEGVAGTGVSGGSAGTGAGGAGAGRGGPAIDGLTVSIGGAIYPDHGSDLAGLMLTADSNVIAAQTRLGDQVRLPRPAGIPPTRRKAG